ncbi:MAG: CAP domain-containing protein [Anaerolineales bacterium]
MTMHRTPRKVLNFVTICLGLGLFALGWLAIDDGAAARAPNRVIDVPGEYATLEEAMAAAQSGDTIQVAAGTYNESGLSLRAGVSLVGAGWETTIIDGAGVTGTVLAAGADTLIENVTIRGSGEEVFDGGIWVSNGAVTVRDARLTDNETALWAWCFDAATCDIHITVTQSIVDANQSGVNSNEWVTFTLRNNTFARNANSAVILNNARSLAENNLIINTTDVGLNNAGGATIRYNDVWGNGRDYVNGAMGPGSLSLDPLFRDAALGDYRLQATSPVIAAGTPPGTDMGALAFTPVGAPPGDVTVTQAATRTWDVRWSDAGAVGYHLYYGPCSRETTTRVDVGAALAHQIVDVAAADAHYIAVSAYDAQGRESAVAVAPGRAGICPTAPANLMAGAFPEGRIRLAWENTTSLAAGFHIERATSIFTPTTYTRVATVPSDTLVYTDTPPALEATYWYRVQAYNADGLSLYSDPTYNATFEHAPNEDERYLLVLINEARADPGVFGYGEMTPVPPLAYNPLLNYAARSHSQAILNAGFAFGHVGLLGRGPTERARAVGYPGGVAENLIQGMTGPAWVESSHQAFMNSEGHRLNLMGEGFNEAGIGHSYDVQKGGNSYWKGQYTETFSGRPDLTLPHLPSGIVTPYVGEETTTFTYTVNYYHAEGLAPTSAQVVIDGTARAMALASGAADHGTYRYATTLPVGAHTYYFDFGFEDGSARLPSTGAYAGPNVYGPDPDLYVTAITTPTGEIIASVPASLTATIRNAGIVSVQDAAVHFYRGDPAGDARLLGATTVSLGADESRAVAITWIPVITGPSDVYVVVDPDDEIAESNEENNTAHTPVDVTPATLYLTKQVTPTGLVSYGDVITYTATLSAAPGSRVRVYDPLQDIEVIRLVTPAPGLEVTDKAITGTIDLPSSPLTLTFAARVKAPRRSDATVEIVNQICGYPYGRDVENCTWSNVASIQSHRPYDAQIEKSRAPAGALTYGAEVTYTLVIAAAQGTRTRLYDPLPDLTFARFITRPAGVISAFGALPDGTLGDIVTGTLEVTPTEQVTIQFVARAGLPGTIYVPEIITNRACIYPITGTVADCRWSNTVINQELFDIYLPLLLRNHDDNAAPYVPRNPSPADGAVDQDLAVDLHWTGGDPDGDAVTYKVLLDAEVGTPTTVICNDIAATMCDPGALAAETTYVWYVIATDEHGKSTAGPAWSFTTASAPPEGWFDYLNYYRALADLPPVVENEDWSEGCELHSRYMVKNDYLGHEEKLGNPWYTPEGEAAGQNGNTMVSSDMSTPDEYPIDLWMQGPFHAIGILDPRLGSVGFGSYREEIGTWRMGATLDIIRGLGDLPDEVRYPVMWPGDGARMPLLSYTGGESPDPLASCADYVAPTGPPLILQLSQGNITPEVTATSLQRGTVSLAHCVFDETSYTHSDGSTQELGRNILGARDAVVVMPRRPLTAGETYSVSVTANGETHTWSFVATGGAVMQSSEYETTESKMK